MESDTAELTNTEVIPTAISPDAGSTSEEALTADITELWSVHVQAQHIVKRTRADLKAVRDNLAEKLFEMKQLLAKTGRSGGWTSFLSQHGIARTSADRLCASHQKVLGLNTNGTSGAIKELSAEEIDQAAKSVWARVGKKLVSHQAKYEFFSRLIVAAEVAHELFDDGVLLLLDPPPAQEVFAATQAPAAAVQ